MISLPFEAHVTDHYPLVCEQTPRVFKTLELIIGSLRLSIANGDLRATLTDDDILRMLQRCEDVLTGFKFGSQSVIKVAITPWLNSLDDQERDWAKHLCANHVIGIL